MPDMPLSIFISYSRTDIKFVSDLEADLKEHGFRTWVDRSKLEGGDEWLDKIQQAIADCHVLLVVLSSDAMDSKYVKMEYRYALHKGKVIIPLHYQYCPEVPMELQGIQWIDFLKPDNQGLQELLRALDLLKQKQLSSPSHQEIIDLVQEIKELPFVAPRPAPAPQDQPSMIPNSIDTTISSHGLVSKTSPPQQQSEPDKIDENNARPTRDEQTNMRSVDSPANWKTPVDTNPIASPSRARHNEVSSSTQAASGVFDNRIELPFRGRLTLPQLSSGSVVVPPIPESTTTLPPSPYASGKTPATGRVHALVRGTTSAGFNVGTGVPYPGGRVNMLSRTPPSFKKKRKVWIILSLIFLILLIITSYSTWRLLPSFLSSTPIITPVSHQSITLKGGESITIGISDGSFPFRTQTELNSYSLPRGADGETCIYDENNRILTSRPQVSHLTIVAVVSLSDTKADHTYSFGLGNATLQGFCQKQISYNSNPDNKVKVRILVANIGVQDAPVLQKTMPIITQQLVLLSQQDSTFIGTVGFPFSASLDDHNPGYSIDTMNQLKRAGIPAISTAAAASDSNFDTQWTGYFYRMNPGNEAEAKVATYYAYYKQHKKTAFVFYDSTNPYSASLEKAFIVNFQGTLDTRDIRSSDFTQPLPDLNTHPPDMIFCACVASSTSPDFSILSQDLQQYPNLKDGKVMLMGADGLYNPEGRHITYRNIFFTTFAFPDTIYNTCNSSPNNSAKCSPEQLDFYANYCKRFDPEAYKEQPSPHPSKCATYGLSRPSKSTMLAYDALSTLLWAYDRRLSVSTSLRDNVRQKLPDVNFQGITGWIQLGKISSNPVHKMILVVSVNKRSLGRVTDYCGKFTSAVSNYVLSPQQDC